MDAQGNDKSPARSPRDPDDEAEADRVLGAASELFAEHGPRMITLKWVGKDAGVPIEWIVSRWPTVDDLLAAVLERGGAIASAESPIVPIIHGTDFTEEADAAFATHDRVIVRAILDGFNPAELMSHFPLLDRLVADLMADGLEEPAARSQAFQIAIVELGWRLFGSTVLAACRLEGEAAGDAVARLRAVQQHLARPPDRDPTPRTVRSPAG